MAQQQRQLSTRDEIYLTSTSFEVYMAAGAVFLLIFTAGFMLGVKVDFAWLIWPGAFLGVLSGYITLKIMERREQRRKLAEIEAEMAQRDRTTR